MKLKYLASLVARLYGTWAEFGEQEAWPAVRAATDLSGYQYRIMRFSAAETCNVASNAVSAAAAEAPAGVLQNTPSSGQAAGIAYGGFTKVMAGAAVTARAFITTNGSGKAIAAVSGDMVMGRAVLAAAATDEIISAVIFPAVRGGSVA